MSASLDPVSLVTNSRRKRVLDFAPYPKKLRSKIPRRKRLRLAPIADTAVGALFWEEDEAEISALQQTSSSSSCFASEITYHSSSIFAGSENPKKLISSAPRRGKANMAIGGYPGDEFRRITRSYARQKENLKAVDDNGNGGGGVAFFPHPWDEGRSSKRGAISSEKPEESLVNAVSGPTISEISHISGGFPNGNLKKATRSGKGKEEVPQISESSCLESVSEANAPEIPKSYEISKNFDEPDDLELDSYLACSEQLSNGSESSDYWTSNELTLSEIESEICRRSPGGYSSGYSSSYVFESSDDFSERSRENSTPSASFSLYLQLALEFSRLNSARASPGHEDENAEEFTLMRLEDRDEEESYQRFRSRERKQALLHDYAEEYSSTTEYGDLITQQRLMMVNWMVEHSNAVELQCETLFLGVSLMDRVLSRGFFKTERKLQVLGIACITLATRLEENQPYNCVRQKLFRVRNNTYSRCEVVAMEWLVQEVLKFQCFHLTTYNFLWFYLKAAKADAEMENLAKYLSVLSLLDHERLSFWPSTVAAGLVILASLASDRDDSCHRVMETHVRTRNDDLPECIQSLDWLVKYAC